MFKIGDSVIIVKNDSHSINGVGEVGVIMEIEKGIDGDGEYLEFDNEATWYRVECGYNSGGNWSKAYELAPTKKLTKEDVL